MLADGFKRARGGDSRPDGAALWFIFSGQDMLLSQAENGVAIPRACTARELAIELPEDFYFGRLAGTPCVAALLPPEHVTDGYVRRDLRTLYGLVPESQWLAAGVAFQLANWADDSRFCPRTGDRTQLKSGEWAMECPSCGLLQYPRVHPCVIVLVHDGDRILMTRQSSWPVGRYGLVAGFVEAGESLEQCLVREVREETGVRVDDLRYFSSQPWPFPHQLMTGFTARYAGGDLSIDRSELEDAAWFAVDKLPILPPPLSIARRIIDAHVFSRSAERIQVSSSQSEITVQ